MNVFQEPSKKPRMNARVPFLSVPCGAGLLLPAAGVLARLGVGSRWHGEAWTGYWEAAAGVCACKGALYFLYAASLHRGGWVIQVNKNLPSESIRVIGDLVGWGLCGNHTCKKYPPNKHDNGNLVHSFPLW
jgi:hypothetical protein